MQTIITIDSGNPADYPALASLYDAEGGLEISAWCSGDPVQCDYGVPNSPVWTEIWDVRVTRYEVNGVLYTPTEAEAKFGTVIEDEMWQLCTEAAESNGDWE